METSSPTRHSKPPPLGVEYSLVKNGRVLDLGSNLLSGEDRKSASGPLRVGRQGPSESVRNCGDRATRLSRIFAIAQSRLNFMPLGIQRRCADGPRH